MSEEQMQREDEVFGQELSVDDLDAAAGGGLFPKRDSDTLNCVSHVERKITGGKGFPNCAATVEDGSWCSTNDACHDFAVNYFDMGSCKKAWE